MTSDRLAIRLSAAMIAAVVALVALPLAASPVSAAPASAGTPRLNKPFTLNMVDGGGFLTLRGGEPRELENPTSVSGTVNAADNESAAPDPGTGAITNGTFATPKVSFQQNITSPIVATVYIDATFTQLTPGNLTGSVDTEGNVSLTTALKVDLHVEVGRNPTLITADCTSTPVTLTLGSDEPYNSETGEITLSNSNFTVPPVDGPNCESNVKGAVNDQLAGAGHALSLRLQGELPLPEVILPATTTDLDNTPEGRARVGQEVTLTATVTPVEATETTPTGIVEFRDGTQVLDTVPLEADGTAVLATDALGAGTRSLTARYRGDSNFQRSASPPQDYIISANPALTWDLPHTVELFSTPTDFTVTATNTGLGQNLENARIDVAIQRVQGTGPIGPVSGNPRITLDQVDGETVTPIPLTFSGSGVNQRLDGSIGAGTGTPLPPGASLEDLLRLTFPNNGTVSPTACGTANRLCPGPLKITFALQLVDPGTGAVVETVASETGQTMLVEATRRASTIVAGNAGFPPAIPATPAVTPHTVRAGNNIRLNVFNVNPSITGVTATGTVAFTIDGTPVGVLPASAPLSAGYQLEVPCCSNNNYSIPTPRSLLPGTHVLGVRYSGNDLLLPSTATFNFEVAATQGLVYECERTGIGFSYVGRANVVAQGSVPAVVADGATATVSHSILRMLFDRGPSGPGSGIDGVFTDFTELEVVYSTEGSSSSTGVTRTNTTRMDVAGDPDQVVEFPGLAMSITADGDPGEVVPVTMEEFRLHFNGVGGAMVCKPVASAITLDTFTVAGTQLAVTPGGPVRSGDAVTLEATTAPASGGVIEFRDGTDTIGVVPVNAEGKATMATSSLAAGEYALTARYFGGFAIPSTTSDVVALVVEATACDAFAEDGTGAVVRLVYLELLGRCPDQGGYDYWVGRLEAGLSAEVFARRIAATPEAVGRVVDDAYETMLGRRGDGPGRAFWTGRLTASGRYDQLLADLGASEEFWNQSGQTNLGFVTRVYERLLNRSPEQAGLGHWVGRLDSGVSRRVLIRTLANLDEPLGVLVTASYGEILDRTPDTTERADGIAHLRRTGDRSGLYAQLIGRPEFATRAGTYPNPT